MPAMFCRFRLTIEWNDGSEPYREDFAPYREDFALYEAESVREAIIFEAAKATTGDKHPKLIVVELYDFHTELWPLVETPKAPKVEK
jgi:hypothetical protein